MKKLMTMVLCIVLLFCTATAYADMLPTPQALQNIENKFGPFIRALVEAVGIEYAVMDEDVSASDIAGYFSLMGLNVANIKERNSALESSLYNSGDVSEAVYDTLIESSEPEIRAKASNYAWNPILTRNVGDLGDESTPIYLLSGLAVLTMAGAIVVHKKRKSVQ